MDDPEPLVRDGRRHDLAVHAPGFFGEPREVLDREGHLAPGLGQRLAVLLRDQPRERIGPFGEEVPRPEQHLAPLQRGQRRPLRERPGGGIDRRARLVGTSIGNERHGLGRGRIQHLKLASAVAVDPAPVDEQGKRSHRHRSTTSCEVSACCSRGGPTVSCRASDGKTSGGGESRRDRGEEGIPSPDRSGFRDRSSARSPGGAGHSCSCGARGAGYGTIGVGPTSMRARGCGP